MSDTDANITRGPRRHTVTTGTLRAKLGRHRKEERSNLAYDDAPSRPSYSSGRTYFVVASSPLFQRTFAVTSLAVRGTTKTRKGNERHVVVPPSSKISQTGKVEKDCCKVMGMSVRLA